VFCSRLLHLALANHSDLSWLPISGLTADASFLIPANREDGKVIGQLVHEKKVLKKRVDDLEKTVSNLRAEINALKAGQT
jgi:hypothetical protein